MMKKRLIIFMLFLILAILIFSVSCNLDRDDTDKDSLTLTGTWETTLYFAASSDYYDGTYIIEQYDDGNLDGIFVFSDGSGITKLSSGSKIDGNDVTLKWTYTDGSSLTPLTFQGEVNEFYNDMGGVSYYDGMNVGTWRAEKTSASNLNNYVIALKGEQADLQMKHLLKNSLFSDNK